LEAPTNSSKSSATATETVSITDGYDFSQYETLRTIELYHNSKFTIGNTDSLAAKAVLHYRRTPGRA
jgi:hypothetical protein